MLSISGVFVILFFMFVLFYFYEVFSKVFKFMIFFFFLGYFIDFCFNCDCHI